MWTASSIDVKEGNREVGVMISIVLSLSNSLTFSFLLKILTYSDNSVKVLKELLCLAVKFEEQSVSGLSVERLCGLICLPW